ncbi:MAG: T9SS type A sorting domain-containing protein [Bacteroidia bacterium]|nr:T9SS type A sorting domain-containing protein [Bacteroidia bacterium]
MKRYWLFFFILHLWGSIQAQNAGTLDITFAQTGITTIDYNNLQNSFSASAVQPDGKIVVVGQADGYPFVGRMLANGAWDPDFGTGGIWIDNSHPESGLNDVAIAASGKIYATGFEKVGVNHAYATVICLLPDGTLETNFGGNMNPGFVKKDMGLGQDFGKAIYIQPDGLILVGGGTAYTSPTTGITSVSNFIFRIYEYGTDDISFGPGGTGYVTLTAGNYGGYVNDIDFHNGVIAVCFSAVPYYLYYDSSIRVSLLDYSDGLEINHAICNYYAGNVSTSQATSRVAFAPDGTLWVTASYMITSNSLSEIDLFKVNTNIFSGTFNIVAYTYYIHHVTGLIATSDNVYIAGIQTGGGKSYVLNFKSDNQINLNFASNGVFETDGVYNASIRDMKLSPDGKLICTGISPSIFHVNTQSVHDDGFMMVLYAQSAVAIHHPEKELNFSVYPNPSKGKFTARWEETGGQVQLSVLDISGKEIFSIYPEKTATEYSPETEMTQGIYFIRITSPERNSVQKLVVN